jgi:drug/metabolite transporter (DMT)-like permease
MMIGIVLSLLTAVLFGASVAIFKYSMGSHERFSVKAIMKHKIWLVGLAVGLLGVVSYIFAMAISPLSTVQPVISFSMVIPILVGAFVFKEKMEGWRWFLVAALALGIILVALS